MTPVRASIINLVGELLRYGMVSIAALAVDFCCLLLLAQSVHYLLAASISFTLGGVVAYLLSVKFVFEQRRVSRASTELGAFIALGLVGLAVNAAIIAMAVDSLGLSLAFSKIMAAGATFTCNFALRKWLLFTRAKNNIEPAVLPVS
jgi:putative flippase GtrA